MVGGSKTFSSLFHEVEDVHEDVWDNKNRVFRLILLYLVCGHDALFYVSSVDSLLRLPPGILRSGVFLGHHMRHARMVYPRLQLHRVSP